MSTNNYIECPIDCRLKGKACKGEYVVYGNGGIWAVYYTGAPTLMCASLPRVRKIEQGKLEKMKA